MQRNHHRHAMQCLRLLVAGMVLFAGGPAMAASHTHEKNVLGEPLKQHSLAPKTGFYRDGFCSTGPEDTGRHVVAATVTEDFLVFTKTRGNDLITPRPDYDFPGLKAGDRWCLCALRWREAEQAGVAPPVDLEATHAHALDYVPLETLKAHAK